MVVKGLICPRLVLKLSITLTLGHSPQKFYYEDKVTLASVDSKESLIGCVHIMTDRSN